MTPVMQSKLYYPDGIHNGNCYAACLASILDLPLWMVPPFEDMFGRGEWRVRTSEWLAKVHGLKMVKHMVKHEAANAPVDLPEFYIANGLSARGVYHSVIYSAGKLAHDPHPSGAGIETVEWLWVLEPIEAEAA